MRTAVVEISGEPFGATMSTAQAATLFSCSEKNLRNQRGQGTLAVEPRKFGKNLRWPSVPVAEAVGLSYNVQWIDDDTGTDG